MLFREIGVTVPRLRVGLVLQFFCDEPYRCPLSISVARVRQMWNGADVVNALEQLGVTHVIWVPDSELGRWEPALSCATGLRLVRVCREGEAFGIAAGLHIGGLRPVVVVQCTGFYEAGDALRNVVFDLGLPIFVMVGYRGFYGAVAGRKDTAAVFLEPVVKAWGLRYKLLTKDSSIEDLAEFYRQTRSDAQAAAALIAESRL